jgi:hypothetical protein
VTPDPKFYAEVEAILLEDSPVGGEQFWCRAFDWLFSSAHLRLLDRAIVFLSAAGLLLHLALIFLARSLAEPPLWIAATGKNYLAAISTPFTFILFNGVLLLFAAIPKSTAQSIAAQFEVVSLIFVRGFFNNLAQLGPDAFYKAGSAFLPAVIDAATGLAMFFLVAVFRHFASPAQDESTEDAVRFIGRKKLVALILTIVFLSMAARSVWQFLSGAAPTGEARPAFYAGIFSVMIFADVLLLVLSKLACNSYARVFRNAAFVISTVLLRLSLTEPHPYGPILGIVGMTFGILTTVIYNVSTGGPVRQGSRT